MLSLYYWENKLQMHKRSKSEDEIIQILDIGKGFLTIIGDPATIN